MSSANRPSFSDVQHTARIVCECLELGRDPILWRRHLASQLTALIPASVALVYELDAPKPPSSTTNGETEPALNPVLIDEGWLDDSCRSSFYEYLQAGCAKQNPMLGAIMGHDQGLLITDAFDVEDQAGWHARPDADYMNEARVEFNCLTHAFVLPSRRRDVVTLHRHRRGQGWTPRERVLLSLLFQSIGTHLGGQLRPIGGPSILDLPPRAIGVLDGFMRGLSSKQVALERGLSVHTVNEYAKLIHTHFAVQSRGELLALLAGVSHRHQIQPLFGDRG